ncbi:MAG: hemerythrin family protein [Sulfurimonas sp.]
MLIDIKNMPLVAMEFMNNTHTEDVEIINKLYELILAYEASPTEENKKKIDEQYGKWFEHTIEHFRVEEEMMQEKKFPPYPMHKGEHDNALSVMDEVFRHWQAKGDISVLKNYFNEHLVPWLVNHINTMDTVTARFFDSGVSPCAMR